MEALNFVYKIVNYLVTLPTGAFVLSS